MKRGGDRRNWEGIGERGDQEKRGRGREKRRDICNSP